MMKFAIAMVLSGLTTWLLTASHFLPMWPGSPPGWQFMPVFLFIVLCLSTMTWLSYSVDDHPRTATVLGILLILLGLMFKGSLPPIGYMFLLTGVAAFVALATEGLYAIGVLVVRAYPD